MRPDSEAGVVWCLCLPMRLIRSQKMEIGRTETSFSLPLVKISPPPTGADGKTEPPELDFLPVFQPQKRDWEQTSEEGVGGVGVEKC